MKTTTKRPPLRQQAKLPVLPIDIAERIADIVIHRLTAPKALSVATPPKTQPPVPLTLEQVLAGTHELSGALHEGITQLECRLNPLLTPPSPANECEGTQVTPGLSPEPAPLTSTAIDLGRILHHAIARLHELQRRLQLAD